MQRGELQRAAAGTAAGVGAHRRGGAAAGAADEVHQARAVGGATGAAGGGVAVAAATAHAAEPAAASAGVVVGADVDLAVPAPVPAPEPLPPGPGNGSIPPVLTIASYASASMTLALHLDVVRRQDHQRIVAEQQQPTGAVELEVVDLEQAEASARRRPGRRG
ncbi:MAG: hypothetical protein R2939_05395 [Kofleriaceae bacterium]